MRWIPWTGSAIFISGCVYVAAIPFRAGGVSALSVSFAMLALVMSVFAVSIARASSVNIEIHRRAAASNTPTQLRVAQEQWARAAKRSFACGMALMATLSGFALLGWLG